MKEIRKLADGSYEFVTKHEESVILGKRKRLLRHIQDMQEDIKETKKFLARFNIALGRDAEDETG
jgi:hypothetical protein